MSEFLTIPSNINSYIRTKKLHIKTNINKPNENIIKSKSKILSLLSIPQNINIESYKEKQNQKNQQNFLNSLLTKNKSRKIIGFEQYDSVLSKSLNHYKSKGLTDEEISEINSNRNIKEESTKKNLSTNKFQININDFDFKNPFQSLNIINDNNSVFNHISRDVLVRQRNLFNKSIEVLEGNLQKFNVKMPKIKVSNLNTKISDEISMINLVDNNQEDKNTNVIPSDSGELRLFSYFRYPHKNFPEGRSQFSICIKENHIIISGGLSSNMNSMQLWSLNIQKLQWNKINTNNTTHSRYGHTSTYFQNKIYYFGGKSKEGTHDILIGLEIYNVSDKSFTIPQDIIDPRLRRNHISCLIGQQILFHGGIDLDNEVLNDCLLLNLNPLKWIKLAINSYSPMPRVYGHASCLVVPSNILVYTRFNVYRYPDEETSDKKSKGKLKQRGLYIFGGKTSEGDLSNDLWVLILGQKPVYWEKVKTNGTPPSPRYCHTMDFYEKSNFLIIHGGRNDYLSSNSALDDTFILDLHNLGWVKIQLYSNIPNFKVFSRYGHKSILFSNKLIILGGVNNNNYIGSCLFIVNLDFYYNTKIKSKDQILLESLKNNKNNENDDNINKLKRKFRKSLKELGIVSPITLPPIK